MGLIQKLNENGWYQKFDTDKNCFVGEPLRPYDKIEVVETDSVADFIDDTEPSDIAKNVTSIDQIEHQLVFTEDGRTIDLDKKHFDVIEENGKIVFDDDGKQIISIAKEMLNYETFIRTYEKSAKEALLLLLAVQSNKMPLKRGGIDIGYMVDILTDHMIMDLTESGSVMWEALGATQSSRPEDSEFFLTVDDIKPYVDCSESRIYEIFNEGSRELEDTNLKFDTKDKRGANIMVHWNSGARFVPYDPEHNEKGYFYVKTNDFFRVLMSSSGILHGTHWNRRVARKLKGYARSLYFFCARNKKYTKYPGAIPGVKELTVQETQYEFKTTIAAPQLWQKLQQAEKKINEAEGSEFIVHIQRIPAKGKFDGFRFEIKESRIIDIEAKETPSLPVNDEPKTENFEILSQLKMLFSISGIVFTDNELEKIAKAVLRYNKDANYLMQIIPVFNERLNDSSMDPIENKVGYFCRMIEQGVSSSGTNKNSNKSNNKFNNFKQRDYDMDELEKKLLGH